MVGNLKGRKILILFVLKNKYIWWERYDLLSSMSFDFLYFSVGLLTAWHKWEHKWEIATNQQCILLPKDQNYIKQYDWSYFSCSY